MSRTAKDDPNEFEREAKAGRTTLPAEFWDFLVHNKKWWLLPILLLLALVTILVFLASTGVAPFIYTIF